MISYDNYYFFMIYLSFLWKFDGFLHDITEVYNRIYKRDFEKHTAMYIFHFLKTSDVFVWIKWKIKIN